ncbi:MULTISPECIES: chromosome segregation protein SMC [unclassified Legionella]|uniref:chromosome segregation protein SMC n=1 Tax=unclassified Legionella TaxID=2622702 RepID=UPI001055FE38|nr:MULTISPECIES: chromosome segregation protein SMC [unclassified Legionella]MDI9819207.1 chromosome segregation protein SMC [Legionella sp. PL877]
MQLKELKLAGFKSFVDPTVVPFPSQLVAVVGPNGCGKSNVIDAVRWVMGESSAKSLRGESMTDVIFNGSSQRKAVGQASVELIFNNSLGRLQGQYASYQEIAVKRVVSRDGESCYFLNGSRCRRKDITDLFLGTGAGARGYSIIGQGTISRIVEARPEELRGYLEEAAGVSRYKERRRETLLRMTHAQDNLARVADIREELDKQLHRLERQAKAAERYKALKASERLCKSEILALKWKSLTEEQLVRQNTIRQLAVEYEKYQANITEAFSQSATLREKLRQDNDVFQQIQTRFYQLATEIARLEESVQQNQREKQRLKADQQQMQTDWQSATSQIQQDNELISISQDVAQQLQQNLDQQQALLVKQQQLLMELQRQQMEWSEKDQKVQQAFHNTQREIQVGQVRIQHIAQQRQQSLSRLEKMAEEQARNEAEPLLEALEMKRSSLAALRVGLQQKEDDYQQIVDASTKGREQLSANEILLHQMQDKIHQLTTEQAGLYAAQQAALGRNDNHEEGTGVWKDKPRLVEAIRVDEPWRYACELVFAEGLQAVFLETLDELWPKIEDVSASMAFLTEALQTGGKSNHPRLSDKIKGLNPCWPYRLDKIYTAINLTQAREWLPDLSDDESIVTADGYWIAKGWVKIANPGEQDQAGLLARQEALAALDEALATTQEQLGVLKMTRDNLQLQVRQSEQALDAIKQELLMLRDEVRTCEAVIREKERAVEQAKTRQALLVEESEDLRLSLEELALEQDNAERLLSAASLMMTQYEQEQRQLTDEKKNWESALSRQSQTVEEARSILHQTQLQYDREKIKTQQLGENVKREQLRLVMLNERMEILASRLVELETPGSTLSDILEEKVLQHGKLESQLSGYREKTEALSRQLESLEASVRAEEKNAQGVQERMQQEQMQEQALAVRAGGILESLSEFHADTEQLLAGLPVGVTQSMREKELEDIADKIKRLGAVNLVAVEEYQAELERKQHLDHQYQDLVEALTTLDAAIKKMDRETEQRLRATFSEVNTAFQSLFPRLFGGGRAMLELTCDNLLEAGVLVMAQPPGKRNSTIHLLSGGEKAMTAVALVFAIFQLNPSPFCMLDEVDAPLDDVNVGRFCTLVKEMSQFVQFLFITHNKVTMELADHLIGVTMREPGVSRVVAVDVEQALSMSSSEGVN